MLSGIVSKTMFFRGIGVCAEIVASFSLLKSVSNAPFACHLLNTKGGTGMGRRALAHMTNGASFFKEEIISFKLVTWERPLSCDTVLETWHEADLVPFISITAGKSTKMVPEVHQ